MKKYKVLSALLAASLIIQTLPVTEVFAAPDTGTESTDKESTVSYGEELSDTIEFENIEISTVDEFLAFAESCHLDSWSANKIVSLKQDIDLTGTSFETIPVFAGIFDGGGHSISGFRPTEQSYIVGLFRYVKEGGVGTNHGIITFCNNQSDINSDSAWVEEDDEMSRGSLFNLQSLDSEPTLFSGVDAGGIAGYSNGLIERCNNYGIVGYEHTGYNTSGIAGRQAGIVQLCTNSGDIYGRKDIGGIVGQMELDIEIDETQSLRNAVNDLHDLIEKTLDDMHDGKDTLKSDLDNLGMYGDGALSSGDALVGQMTDYSRISLLSTVGGRLFASQLNPAAGEQVIVTVMPDENYSFTVPSVIDANGNEISCTMSGEDATGRKYAFTMPSANVKVTVFF